MKTPQLNILSADNPLTNPQDDRLGYAPFAKHLAESICRMSPPDGLVMAVYAPWGSGKSSLLNFILHYLKEKSEEEQPIVVPFNPWWFSGQEDLTRNFFKQLLAVLNTKLKSLTQETKDKLASFSQSVSRIPGAEILGTIAKSSLPGLETAISAVQLFTQPEDVYKLKEDIEKELRNQQKRILVVIDDIDRLTSEEVRQLFRVIKAVANFPNVVYLLLFDKEIVVKSLEQNHMIPDAEAYLEKIVQVSFNLPIPDKISLRDIFLEKVDKILVDTPKELFDQTYWGNVYYEGIDHFIVTPRDSVRLINALSVTYPAVKAEVNPVDFVAIETIRLFCPLIYEMIRRHPDIFINTGYNYIYKYYSEKEMEKLYDSWIEQVEEQDRDTLKKLLKYLFPTNLSANKNHIYSDESYSKWRRQLRICSREIFPIYFRLALSEGNLSSSQIQQLVALAASGNGLRDKLLELVNRHQPDGTTQVKEFLERFRDYTKEIPLDSIPSIIETLFNIGDQLLCPEDAARSIFCFGNDMSMSRIFWQLLYRIETQEKRFEIVKKAIQQSHSLTMIVKEVSVWGQQQGKYSASKSTPETEWLFNEEQLKELEQITLLKIQESSQQNLLLQTPEWISTLYRWRDWGNEQEVREWVENIIQDDKTLVLYLEKLKPFVDLGKIVERIRRIVKENYLTNNQQRAALQQMLKEHDLV